jgi:hypothetical protein
LGRGEVTLSPPVLERNSHRQSTNQANSVCRIIASSSLILPRTLAIRFTQAFHCPLDGRVCSGNRRRLLGNEPLRYGDLGTQNGIPRQVTLVVHC